MSVDIKNWVEDPTVLPKVVKRAEQEHSSRQAECKAYLRAYWDRPVAAGVRYDRPYRESAIYDVIDKCYGGNLTCEVVDAAVSILCRQLSPKVMPKGDDFELEQGCKEATRLIEGVNDNADFLGIAKQAIRDGATADIGPAKGFVEDGEIKFERINPLELYWIDNGTDTPRTLMHVTPVDRYELIDRYPKYKAKIKDMRSWVQPTVVGVDLPAMNRHADSVKFVEAYSTMVGDKAGKHVLMAGDEVLDVEDWEHDITPFFRFVWSNDFRGYAGRQLARIVSRYDSANRRLLRKLYEGLDGANTQLLVNEDTDTDGPSDMAFGRWTWSGAIKPELLMPQTVSPDLIARIEANYTRAYAEGGVNQSMATGAAPARYTSGAAQREFVDIANTRLLDAQQQVERFWKDGAKVTVMLSQQAKKTHVRLKGENRYVSVSMPRLPQDKFKVSFGLSSGLSLTPAGRKQDLADYQQLMPSVMDEAAVARSLALPDVEQLVDELNAPRDLIKRQISQIVDMPDETPFPMPSAMMDLNAAIRLGKQQWQLCEVRGNYPPARVEKLRKWILACQARVQMPAPAAAGPPIVPGLAAPAPGAPTTLPAAPPAAQPAIAAA